MPLLEVAPSWVPLPACSTHLVVPGLGEPSPALTGCWGLCVTSLVGRVPSSMWLGPQLIPAVTTPPWLTPAGMQCPAGVSG